MKYKFTKEQISKAVETSFSLRATMIKLGMQPSGSNFETIKTRIKDFEIDTNHFTGQGHMKGKVGVKPPNTINLEEILVENSNYGSTNRIKKKLLENGTFQHTCCNCNQKEWLGYPIPLQLHHKNGVRSDNRLENLELLCPNCHAMTETYCGKNIGR